MDWMNCMIWVRQLSARWQDKYPGSVIYACNHCKNTVYLQSEVTRKCDKLPNTLKPNILSVDIWLQCPVRRTVVNVTKYRKGLSS
jgi:hypothetical protein